ncbi:MAG TPA: hypothetical protein VFX16_18765 [Pseudonocardiaceae bacterium]|nr:hypothetical protein [Pseudonocardiaceae bacterium]
MAEEKVSATMAVASPPTRTWRVSYAALCLFPEPQNLRLAEAIAVAISCHLVCASGRVLSHD